ncbi:MAG TPA: hypothetical protein VK116_01105, partial [Planctomycetota bacterium]|nr:hypothetical protein [Planctomycetota bacterium]
MTTDALLELVRCEYEAGRFSDACEHIAEALARPAFRDGGGAARATLLLYQGRIESLRGRASDAASSYERSLKVWPVTAERVLLAEAWIDIGALLSRLGQLDRALEHMIRGLRLALDEDEPNAIVHALHHLALFLVDADESVAATELAKAAAQIARSQGDFAAELRSIAVLVRASLESSRPESLDAVLERGRELARDPTLPVEAAAFRLEEAWVVYSRGDLATAMQLARGVVETARSLELRPLLADVLLLIACIDGHPDNPRSNVVRALESLERLLDADEARASPRVRFEVLRALEA